MALNKRRFSIALNFDMRAETKEGEGEAFKL